MFISIADGSSNSEHDETDQMIDHTDKNSDEDSQSTPPKKKKSEKIKWKRQTFNSIGFPENYLISVLYFVNLSKNAACCF